MTSSQRLALVRSARTVIYLVMVAAIFVVLYGGLSGASGLWLWIAIGLVSMEVAVFVASGMRCPLTRLVSLYSDPAAEVSDTFFPKKWTLHTLTTFVPLLMVGFTLLAWRWLRA